MSETQIGFLLMFGTILGSGVTSGFVLLKSSGLDIMPPKALLWATPYLLGIFFLYSPLTSWGYIFAAIIMGVMCWTITSFVCWMIFMILTPVVKLCRQIKL